MPPGWRVRIWQAVTTLLPGRRGLEIYTDTDEVARRDALTRLHDLLDDDEN